jgi:hypothetical protein
MEAISLQELADGNEGEMEQRLQVEPPVPVAEVLRFLLPGLSHLSAEESARAILMEHGIAQLLVDYMLFHWAMFCENSTNRPSEVVSPFLTFSDQFKAMLFSRSP